MGVDGLKEKKVKFSEEFLGGKRAKERGGKCEAFVKE